MLLVHYLKTTKIYNFNTVYYNDNKNEKTIIIIHCIFSLIHKMTMFVMLIEPIYV